MCKAGRKVTYIKYYLSRQGPWILRIIFTAIDVMNFMAVLHVLNILLWALHIVVKRQFIHFYSSLAPHT